MLLRIVAAAGLAVDAYVHADLAPGYDVNAASVSQGDLFRLEAALAALAALLVLFLRSRLVQAYALLVAAGGLAAVLVYHYADLGTLGPLPDMYEPYWYTEKVVSAVSQAVATVAAAALLSLPNRHRPQRY
ncbi:hypothetical protein [Streptomyces beihaiensis]|uniref:Integral membrane protein n=1 Tax=Streptomyces beihaiensis TaxID=2984495 RepID=A0ABT3TUT6_9ACTN|nr:hypothetical protein [Streptomyces beihaiensis]MCX3060803.1 hypothetical protein [Streptomyces beihaiensis]